MIKELIDFNYFLGI